MKGLSKALVALGVVAVAAAVAMPALAQCPTSREFGAQGNGMLTGRIIIDTAANGFPNDGNELGSVYEPGSGFNNGGPHFGGADTSCPVGVWYLTGGMFLGTNSGIQGFVADPSCLMNFCPPGGASLVSVVEDENGGDAGFIAYMTQETPAAIRWYDHSATKGTAGVANAVNTDAFQSYPTVSVTGSSGPPPGTTVTNNYSDLGANVHVAVGGAPAAPNAAIVSYDIMSHHGPGDPGRNRGAWTLEKSIPYGGAVVGDNIAVPCPTTTDDTFLAVGATFAGGVQSLLVGAPTAIECDPNLAEPDTKIDRRDRRRDRGAKPLGRGR